MPVDMMAAVACQLRHTLARAYPCKTRIEVLLVCRLLCTHTGGSQGEIPLFQSLKQSGEEEMKVTTGDDCFPFVCCAL